MTEFFKTIMGKQFFDATMPRIARSIEALNETVKGLNARLDINQKHDKEFVHHAREARGENEEIITLLRDSSELARRACEMAGALQQLLWCDGEDTEHDSDTLGEVANITRRYGFGPGEAEGPKELWDDDLIQFARLLCEIQASSTIDLKVLADSMNIPGFRVNELFDRAERVWEQSKKDNCPIPCCERDHDGDGDCDRHPSLLEQLKRRYSMEDLDDHIHEVKAEEAKAINNSSFEEQVAYLRDQCGDAWIEDALLSGRD